MKPEFTQEQVQKAIEALDVWQDVKDRYHSGEYNSIGQLNLVAFIGEGVVHSDLIDVLMEAVKFYQTYGD